MLARGLPRAFSFSLLVLGLLLRPASADVLYARSTNAHDLARVRSQPSAKTGVADWDRIRASVEHVRNRYSTAAMAARREESTVSQPGTRGADQAGGSTSPQLEERKKRMKKKMKKAHVHANARDNTGTNQGSGVTSRLHGAFHDDESLNYHMHVKIGTKPDGFKMLVDTGSTVAWVVGPRCKKAGCRGPDNGADRKIFDPNSSSSTCKALGTTFSIDYTRGKVKGDVFEDSFTFGAGALQLGQQRFGVAEDVSPDFADSVCDGLLGLAPVAHTTNGAPTFLSALFNGGTKLDTSFISIFLGRPSSGTARRSEIRFGAQVNYDLIRGDEKKISFFPLIQSDFWAIRVRGLGVKGATDGQHHQIGGAGDDNGSGDKGIDAVIDTGTTLIHAPSAEVDKFWSGVPGSRKQIGGELDSFWSFPCDHKLEAELLLSDGTRLDISALDLNMGKVSEGSAECVGALYAMDGAGFVLGQAALKSVYTVLDWAGRRVGLAQAI
ncbi:unnamed protein product [Tilletia controversa]|nr:unnamed protein product [Tilletia controversa]